MRVCTRRLEFDAGHRLVKHESKCAHPHGHRYVVEVTCGAAALDEVGRVIDFGAIKAIVGTFIDDNLDHAFIFNQEDREEISRYSAKGYKHWVMPCEPSAENLAAFLFRVSQELLGDEGIVVMHVRIFETPNCWADYDRAEFLEDMRKGRES